MMKLNTLELKHYYKVSFGDTLSHDSRITTVDGTNISISPKATVDFIYKNLVIECISTDCSHEQALLTLISTNYGKNVTYEEDGVSYSMVITNSIVSSEHKLGRKTISLNMVGYKL